MPIKTTKNREFNPKRIKQIGDSLQSWNLNKEQIASVLASIIEESGGDPLAKSKNGTYQGLLQWGKDRYTIKSNNQEKELKHQLSYLKRTLNNTTDKVSWTHGGSQSGFKSASDAYNAFHKFNTIENVMKGFSFGYVRPQGKLNSYNNRLKVAKQIYSTLSTYHPIDSSFEKDFKNGIYTTSNRQFLYKGIQ